MMTPERAGLGNKGGEIQLYIHIEYLHVLYQICKKEPEKIWKTLKSLD